MSFVVYQSLRTSQLCRRQAIPRVSWEASGSGGITLASGSRAISRLRKRKRGWRVYFTAKEEYPGKRARPTECIKLDICS